MSVATGSFVRTRLTKVSATHAMQTARMTTSTQNEANISSVLSKIDLNFWSLRPEFAITLLLNAFDQYFLHF